jgi:hypothetical protein
MTSWLASWQPFGLLPFPAAVSGLTSVLKGAISSTSVVISNNPLYMT